METLWVKKVAVFVVLLAFEAAVSVVSNDQTTLLALNEDLAVPGWGVAGSDHCSWRGWARAPSGLAVASSVAAVESLDLAHCNLRGGNLTLISQLKSLKRLDLSYNNFHGSIPSGFGNLLDLEFLDLTSNKLEHSIPRELGNLRNLVSLNLSGNLLVGEIPDDLRKLEKLQDFHISSNRINGSIPIWLGNFTDLKAFAAYENLLSGIVPENLGSLSKLELLNLHSNQLEGSIPKSIFVLGKLQSLILTQNKLTGEIPESIGNCPELSSIRIGNNRLVGAIPKEIGNVSGLTYFEVDNNNLSGEIPTDFSRCANLTLLNLASNGSNGFTGTIPVEFGELTSLQELLLSGNSMFGEIPVSIIKCRNLNKLDLSNNGFNGTIPEQICNMTRLQYLLMSQNSIKGSIPRSIGTCLKLLALHLGSNYLTGIIPPEIGRIKNLQIVLNLSFNHFSGTLPADLGKLDKLVTLDVSNNQLSGDIPNALKGMLSLIEVNFSNNLFTGAVPTFVPFQKSDNSSFSGNKGLCGPPLTTPCADSGIDSEERTFHHKISYRIILAVIGSGLAVFVSVTVIVILFVLREKQEKAAAKDLSVVEQVTSSNKPLVMSGNVFVDNLKQAIDFEAVVNATLKDSNKVSNGTFSTVFKAVMPSGLVLSVKSLKSMDRTVSHHQHKMIRELERLSKLCHENLMRPIGYVIYEDVALLMHDYFPNGTLMQFLHDPSQRSSCEFDWPTRLSIAVGIAEGIAFLHHVAIIHLDISSGNVVLDGGNKPLVGEVEISKLLDPSRGTASISAVAGSFGYIPPEYAYTMQVTAPGNVYSYGVVLLEILTTRQPVDEAFGEGIDLVKWVHTASTRGETPEQILDSKLSTVSFSWRKDMLAALKIALLCTDAAPAKRPKMKKVVEMLQEITRS